jgi:trimeric autotransporter adhesin
MQVHAPSSALPLLRGKRRLCVCLLLASFASGCSTSGTNGPTITTIAGTGADGSSGDGGLALKAEFNSIWGVAVDSKGNVYVSDGSTQVIRKITVSTGIISTYAGNGTFGYSGDKGLATAAQLFGPFGITFDSSDNLYIADRGNFVIRKVTASTGIITTIAGIAGSSKLSGDGGLATLATFDLPQSVAINAAGDVYVGDDLDGRVRKISASTGIITTVAGGGASKAEGVPATSASIQPDGIALDSTGTLYIGDRVLEAVRKVDPVTGLITTIAGNGTYGTSNGSGPATTAALSTPDAIAFSPSGNIYIGDYADGAVHRLDPSNSILYSVAASPQFMGIVSIAFDSSGALYVADGPNRIVRKITGIP